MMISSQSSVRRHVRRIGFFNGVIFLYKSANMKELIVGLDR